MRSSQLVRAPARTNPLGLPSSSKRRRKACKTRTQAELLFDSCAGLGLGTRSTTHPRRHLLYVAEPYEIDGLIELKRESNRLLITGQLLDTSLPAVFRRGVRVTLWNFRKSFVTVRTNEWGEFLGEIEDSGELMVSLTIHLREIVISIRNVLDWPSS